MALADYRLCDVCGSKAFYDARLNYEQTGDGALRDGGEMMPAVGTAARRGCAACSAEH